MSYGICCIVLSLEDSNLKFQKMTYSRFSKLERSEAINLLGTRILNNLNVTMEAIRFCHERGYCYRVSSDLFPLVTYDKAEISIDEFPQGEQIREAFTAIKAYLLTNPVRISTHPDQFNVLATENEEALKRTVKELNFQSWILDQMGCPADYNSPINIHINNNSGKSSQITERFKRGFDLLDDNCRARLVVENDDKVAGWSVKRLMDNFHQDIKCPLTFDYLHHKCHPDGVAEDQALLMCHQTWGSYTPLFHYAESREGSNPRAHADYPSSRPNMYGLNFDIDMEFKMKDRAVALCQENAL